MYHTVLPVVRLLLLQACVNLLVRLSTRSLRLPCIISWWRCLKLVLEKNIWQWGQDWLRNGSNIFQEQVRLGKFSEGAGKTFLTPWGQGVWDWTNFLLERRIGLTFCIRGLDLLDFLELVRTSKGRSNFLWGLVKPSIGEDVVSCLGGIRTAPTLVGEIGICELFLKVGGLAKLLAGWVGQVKCSMPRQDQTFYRSRWKCGLGVKLSARKNKIVQSYCGKEIEIFCMSWSDLISSRQDWSGAAGTDHNLHNWWNWSDFIRGQERSKV